MTASPAFYALDGCYLLNDDAHGVTIEIDRVRRDRSELIGELTVRSTAKEARTLDGAGTVARADLNLSSLRSRQERAKFLQARAPIPDFDWPGFVESFCVQTLAAERVGAPALHLRDVPPSPLDHTIIVEGFPILRQHPICLFGDGGSLKSYLALDLAGQLTEQGLRVLYADWEFTPSAHRDRLVALFPNPPDVLYAKCERPLVSEADRLRRIVRDERIDYLICDSVAFACDGPPESAEIAAAYFRALRLIGVGSLSIAHMTKADNGDQKPFGSAFWHNGFRSSWYVQRSMETVDSDEATIALFHRKSNIGRLSSPLGYCFIFEDGRTTVQTTSVTSVPDLADKLPTWQRIRSLVAHEPLTLAKLADELNKPVDSIRHAVRYHKSLFTKIDGADGVARIALLEKRRAA